MEEGNSNYILNQIKDTEEFLNDAWSELSDGHKADALLHIFNEDALIRMYKEWRELNDPIE